MLKIDEVAYHNPLASKNPFIKCGIGMSALLLAISMPSYSILLFLMILMNSLILGVARIDLKFYLKLLKVPSGFLLLSISMILITVSSSPEGYEKAIYIGGYYIGYTKETLNTSLYLFLRCLTCIQCMYFMTLTVGMNQQIKVLKKLHIPHEIIELIILMYRFIFIFMEEVEQIKLAQEMRFGYEGLKRSYHSTGMLIKLLMKRMISRYKKLCIVLEMKLYNGKFY